MAVKLELDVPRSLDGPAFARDAVRQSFGGAAAPKVLADVLLVVSELVNNAVLHGSGDVSLRVDIDDEGWVTGEVLDHGCGFAGGLDRRGFDDLGGRGLLIVGSVAQRWGVHEGTSHVWFELGDSADVERSGPELGIHRRPDQLEEVEDDDDR